MKISFKEWYNSEFDFIETASLDLSRFPVDEIEFEKEDNDDYEDFKPSFDFEEESFDEEYFRSRCEDQHSIDDYDLNDYSYGEIFDSVEDDPRFSASSVEKWEAQNPKPQISSFRSEEEYESALSSWEEDKDEIESEYENAVEEWEEENEKAKESAIESAHEAMRADIDSCIENSEERWKEEQEERKREYESSIEDEKADFYSKIPPFGKYFYNFKINDSNYKVEIERSSTYYKGEKLYGVFDVFFEGPRKYSLTRDTSPQQAREVYSRLIASVIKFIKEEESTGHPVNGFSFSAHSPEMEIIYDLFYKNYLYPSGFIRSKINGAEFYLKRDYIKTSLNKLNQNDKKEFLKGIISSKLEKKKTIEKVKNYKIIGRENLLFFEQNKNKFLYFKDSSSANIYLCFLLQPFVSDFSVEEPFPVNKIKCLYVKGLYLNPILLMKSDFVQKQIEKEDFVKFVQAALKDDEFYRIYNSPDFKKYNALFYKDNVPKTFEKPSIEKVYYNNQ